MNDWLNPDYLDGVDIFVARCDAAEARLLDLFNSFVHSHAIEDRPGCLALAECREDVAGIVGDLGITPFIEILPQLSQYVDILEYDEHAGAPTH